MYEPLKRRYPCKLTSLDKDYRAVGNGFIFRKKWPYTKIFNYHFLKARYSVPFPSPKRYYTTYRRSACITLTLSNATYDYYHKNKVKLNSRHLSSKRYLTSRETPTPTSRWPRTRVHADQSPWYKPTLARSLPYSWSWRRGSCAPPSSSLRKLLYSRHLL